MKNYQAKEELNTSTLLNILQTKILIKSEMG